MLKQTKSIRRQNKFYLTFFYYFLLTKIGLLLNCFVLNKQFIVQVVEHGGLLIRMSQVQVLQGEPNSEKLVEGAELLRM